MMSRISGQFVLMLAAMLAVAGCTTISRPIYGVTEGQLSSCDGITGCISSQSTSPDHYIEPISFTSLRSDARLDLIAAMRDAGEHRLVSSHRSYVRGEFIRGDAIDDVEFYLPIEDRVIHVRSTTRNSRGDSELQKERIEGLRLRFRELQERR